MQRRATLHKARDALAISAPIDQEVLKPLPPTPHPLQGMASSAPPLSTALDSQRLAIARRLQLWGYLGRVYQGGQVLWFNTVCLSRLEIERGVAEPPVLQARATKWMVLGLTLSGVLDIPGATDFMRSLLALAQEFDGLSDEQAVRGTSRTAQRGLLKSRTLRSRSGTSAALASAEGLSSDDAFLWPNMPFELDYFQTLYTLCDMLAQVYGRMLSFLATPSAGASSPPPQTSGPSPGVVDMAGKVDAKLKKISNVLCKEIDGIARSAIKSELETLAGGGLDVLLEQDQA